MHASFPAGSFLVSGISAWKECLSHWAQPEQRLPGGYLTRQPFAEQGLKAGAVKGAGCPEQEECCVRVVPEGLGRSDRALLNSLKRSCLSSHSSSALIPLSLLYRLFSNACVPLSPSTPRAGGATLAQADRLQGVVGADGNVVNTNAEYLEMLSALKSSSSSNASC